MMPPLKKTLLFLAVACNAAGALAAPAKPAAGGGKVDAAALYHNYCSVCHGDKGDGKSRASNSLNPPPKDFTVVTLSRELMIAVVRDGKPGTAMAGWKTQLTAAELDGVVDYVRTTFMKLADDPKLQAGKALYAKHCVNCHGGNGEGVPSAVSAGPAPRNFADPAARGVLTRERMLASVSDGRAGTQMKGFKATLARPEIENVVDYVRVALMVPESQISGTDAHAGRDHSRKGHRIDVAPAGADMAQPLPSKLKGDAEKGKKFFVANCATCHGVKGDGQGPRAYFINPKPANFISEKYRTTLNRPTIYTIVAAGKLGTEMPAWRHVMSEQEMANVSEYVFRAFIEPGQPKQAVVQK